jgi:hypothetical protein
MSAFSALARAEYYAQHGDALPPCVLDQPEYRQRRRTTAVTAFAALRPGNALEGLLAVQIVLAGAHAADCLREVGFCGEDFARMGRCRAQAASMMRQARATKRILAQEQEVRLRTSGVVDAPKRRTATASAVEKLKAAALPDPSRKPGTPSHDSGV